MSPTAATRPQKTGLAAVAVIGNPNTGKTTLFNALTGLRQRVGNYPGVTVERKTGVCRLDEGQSIELIDLPGTYSLAARSPDEMIAVDVLLGQQPGAPQVAAVLAIADASNPERNFYLVSQLCELNLPVVVALNMMDLAESRGLRIDTARLAAALGTPVIAICANSGRGLPELRAALLDALLHKKRPSGQLPEFPPELQNEVDALAAELRPHAEKLGREISRAEAFRILVDKDGLAAERLAAALGRDFYICRALSARRLRAGSVPLAAMPLAASAKVPGNLTGSQQQRLPVAHTPLLAEEVRVRYAWIKKLMGEAIARPLHPPPSRSDQIDRVATHWAAGTLIFALLMALVFQAIFSWSEPLMKLIEWSFAGLGNLAGAWLAGEALKSMLCDGILAGVGGVLAFLPQICILFLFIGVLEDCGYMARAAFLMDRLLARLGLSGKSFIPMMSGFACGVPGIMATRTIENSRERLITILILPLMTCSARLPIYYLMITTFIPNTPYAHGWLSLRGLVLFAMYCAGLGVAIPTAWLLKKTVVKGAPAPFLLELPVYMLPNWRTVLLRVYQRACQFVKRAGTIILAVTIVVWALSYFPHSAEIAKTYEAKRAACVPLAAVGLPVPNAPSTGSPTAASGTLDAEEQGEYLRQSYFGSLGRKLAPVFNPLGWDWRVSCAVLASFPAREVVVSTLGTLFNATPEAGENSRGLHAALQGATWPGSTRPLFNVPVALSLMVFFALCSQCGATLAVIKRETNSWRWPLFSFAYMTVLAYTAALLAYQSSMALGWGG